MLSYAGIRLQTQIPYMFEGTGRDSIQQCARGVPTYTSTGFSAALKGNSVWCSQNHMSRPSAIRAYSSEGLPLALRASLGPTGGILSSPSQRVRSESVEPTT